MPDGSLSNYLRTARRATGLSQEEVAFLLGASWGSEVSRHERFVQVPLLETALAYEVIYGKPIRELFAGELEKVEARVKERAKELAQKILVPGGGPLVARKREVLERILDW